MCRKFEVFADEAFQGGEVSFPLLFLEVCYIFENSAKIWANFAGILNNSPRFHGVIYLL